MLLVFNKETRRLAQLRCQHSHPDRKVTRSTVLKPATISFGEIKHSEIECVVTDISDSGAKIFYVRPSNIPKHFKLSFKREEKEYVCEVAWREANEFGVRFINND